MYIEKSIVRGIGYKLWDSRETLNELVYNGYIAETGTYDLSQTAKTASLVLPPINDRKISLWREGSGYGLTFQGPSGFEGLRHLSEPTSRLICYAFSEAYYQLPASGSIYATGLKDTPLGTFGEPQLRFAPLGQIEDKSGKFFGAKVTLGTRIPPRIRLYAPTKKFPLKLLENPYLADSFAFLIECVPHCQVKGAGPI